MKAADNPILLDLAAKLGQAMSIARKHEEAAKEYRQQISEISFKIGTELFKDENFGDYELFPNGISIAYRDGSSQIIKRGTDLCLKNPRNL